MGGKAPRGKKTGGSGQSFVGETTEKLQTARADELISARRTQCVECA